MACSLHANQTSPVISTKILNACEWNNALLLAAAPVLSVLLPPLVLLACCIPLPESAARPEWRWLTDTHCAAPTAAKGDKFVGVKNVRCQQVGEGRPQARTGDV